MPLFTPHYLAPYLLRQGDIHTVAAFMYGADKISLSAETSLQLRDGDYLQIFLNRAPNPKGTVIITHGLEGTAESPYVLDTARACLAAGFSVVRWNMRGCGGVGNYQLSWYHSGDTKDLSKIVEWAKGQPDLSKNQLFLVGFSVGGNITLNYLADGDKESIVAAVCISVPIDLAGSARALATSRNRPYMRYLLAPLKARIIAKHEQFRDRVDISNLDRITTFSEFDNRFTAPIHGFPSADEYWRTQSSLYRLNNITTPTLLLSALDDPFLSTSCFPTDETLLGSSVFAEYPQNGGHVGFLSTLYSKKRWFSERIVAFYWSLKDLQNYNR